MRFQSDMTKGYEARQNQRHDKGEKQVKSLKHDFCSKVERGSTVESDSTSFQCIRLLDIKKGGEITQPSRHSR